MVAVTDWLSFNIRHLTRSKTNGKKPFLSHSASPQTLIIIKTKPNEILKCFTSKVKKRKYRFENNDIQTVTLSCPFLSLRILIKNVENCYKTEHLFHLKNKKEDLNSVWHFDFPLFWFRFISFFHIGFCVSCFWKTLSKYLFLFCFPIFSIERKNFSFLANDEWRKFFASVILWNVILPLFLYFSRSLYHWDLLITKT